MQTCRLLIKSLIKKRSRIKKQAFLANAAFFCVCFCATSSSMLVGSARFLHVSHATQMEGRRGCSHLRDERGGPRDQQRLRSAVFEDMPTCQQVRKYAWTTRLAHLLGEARQGGTTRHAILNLFAGTSRRPSAPRTPHHDGCEPNRTACSGAVDRQIHGERRHPQFLLAIEELEELFWLVPSILFDFSMDRTRLSFFLPPPPPVPPPSRPDRRSSTDC